MRRDQCYLCLCWLHFCFNFFFISFVSGGISIKPAAGMGLMKADMGGAATVSAAFEAIARLKVPINVTALVPLCENMPSGCANKPGDVITAMSGKTIEVTQ